MRSSNNIGGLILTDKLRQLAIEFAKSHPFLSDPDEAAGLCFWATVKFADMVSEHGYSVWLIRWQLSEGHYVDHWAVVLSGNRLIDHTRSQVDGETDLFWHTTSYPDSYFCARRYPASLFLKDYRCLNTCGLQLFPSSFLDSARAARRQFDVQHFRPTPKMQLFGMVALAVFFYAFIAWRLFA